MFDSLLQADDDGCKPCHLIALSHKAEYRAAYQNDGKALHDGSEVHHRTRSSQNGTHVRKQIRMGLEKIGEAAAAITAPGERGETPVGRFFGKRCEKLHRKLDQKGPLSMYITRLPYRGGWLGLDRRTKLRSGPLNVGHIRPTVYCQGSDTTCQGNKC